MKIQCCSDLHLEFRTKRKWLKANPIQPVGDILIVAGDTSYLGGETFSKSSMLDYNSDHFQEAYLLPGNHEYYGGYDVANNLKETKEPLRFNLNGMTDYRLLLYNKRF